MYPGTSQDRTIVNEKTLMSSGEIFFTQLTATDSYRCFVDHHFEYGPALTGTVHDKV